MATTNEDFAFLFRKPNEALNLEFKQWLSINDDHGKIILVKSLIALRNFNGGQLVIGITDAGELDPAVPANVESKYLIDDVQQIVSNNSSSPFPIELFVATNASDKVVVITVPPGVTTPVCAKRDICPGEKRNVKVNTVYVRTLSSNGTFSSSEPKAADWDSLVKICFDNREADIGGFVRRQLSSLNPGTLASLLPAISDLLKPAPDNNETMKDLLVVQSELMLNTLKRESLSLPDIGLFKAVARIDASITQQPPTEDFFKTMLLQLRHFYGRKLCIVSAGMAHG